MSKMTETVIFKATPAQLEKLKALALGEGLTVSAVCQRLVDMTPARKVVLDAMVFDALGRSKPLDIEGRTDVPLKTPVVAQ